MTPSIGGRPSVGEGRAPDPMLVGGRYRLERPLGSGGMADVWEATDQRLHRRVAVKILRPDPDASAEGADRARRRFTDEGRIIARHSHPNIVSIFDAGEDAGRAYLVMECLPGQTLADRLARGPLGDHEVRSLMSDVLAGLDAAHAAGVLHRDVKPGNVLLDAEGRWKVADFGIATEIDPALRSGDLTLTGQLLGTPRYTAPERFAGQPATTASDVYSVGVLLREAMAGRADVDPGLTATAARATALDPAQRFPSARAMAAALAGDTVPATVDLGVPDTATVPAALRQAGREPGGADLPTTIAAMPPTQALPGGGRSGRPSRRATVAAAAVGGLVLLASGIALAEQGGDGPPRPADAGPQPTSTLTPSSTTTPATSSTASVTTAATSAPPAATAPASEPTATPAPDKGKRKRGGKVDGKRPSLREGH